MKTINIMITLIFTKQNMFAIVLVICLLFHHINIIILIIT